MNISSSIIDNELYLMIDNRSIHILFNNIDDIKLLMSILSQDFGEIKEYLEGKL